MIDDRWFRQGHIDEQETCLITSNETYLQYTQTQKALEQKKQEAEKHQAEERTHRLKCRKCWIKEMNFWIRSTGATMRFRERRFLQKYPEWN